MPKKLVKIRLTPLNQEITVPQGSNLLKTLQDHHIPIGSACGGMGLCASCKITLLSSSRGLNRPNDCELGIIDRNNLQDSERIACQSSVVGDIEITTPYW